MMEIAGVEIVENLVLFPSDVQKAIVADQATVRSGRKARTDEARLTAGTLAGRVERLGRSRAQWPRVVLRDISRPIDLLERVGHVLIDLLARLPGQVGQGQASAIHERLFEQTDRAQTGGRRERSREIELRCIRTLVSVRPGDGREEMIEMGEHRRGENERRRIGKARRGQGHGHRHGDEEGGQQNLSDQTTHVTVVENKAFDDDRQGLFGVETRPGHASLHRIGRVRLRGELTVDTRRTRRAFEFFSDFEKDFFQRNILKAVACDLQSLFLTVQGGE